MASLTKWTLVQHSACVAANVPMFRRAVEMFSVDLEDVPYIERAGGLVFDHYDDAADGEYMVNYPASNDNFLEPACEGRFQRVKVADETKVQLYLPEKLERDRLTAHFAAK